MLFAMFTVRSFAADVEHQFDGVGTINNVGVY